MSKWLTVWTFQANDTISQQCLPSPINYERACRMCFMNFTASHWLFTYHIAQVNHLIH